MPEPGYKQFCPVALAAEVLCRRWTVVLLRELIAGSTRFNDLRRGVPKMSPTLLSRRLRELELAGVLERRVQRGQSEYLLTPSGRDLRGIVDAMGHWAQKWVDTGTQLGNLDVRLLMWDMRRNLDPTPLPPRRVVIEFAYTDLPAPRRHWWLVVEPGGEVDLCHAEPGFDVHLYVTTDLHTMTAIWMGRTTVRAQRAKVSLDGDREVAASIQQWLGLSPFARPASGTPRASRGARETRPAPTT